MRSLFYFPLTLHFPLNLLLHFLMITTLSTITSNICFTNTAAASTTISYPGASPWLYRRELPNTNLDDDNDHNNNNNDDGYDDDDEHIKDKDIGNNPRRPPEITWLRIWRPLGDPPSSPRGHLLFLVEEDQNISYAAANWEDGAVPEVRSSPPFFLSFFLSFFLFSYSSLFFSFLKREK